jgi:hypothetical protein
VSAGRCPAILVIQLSENVQRSRNIVCGYEAHEMNSQLASPQTVVCQMVLTPVHIPHGDLDYVQKRGQKFLSAYIVTKLHIVHCSCFAVAFLVLWVELKASKRSCYSQMNAMISVRFSHRISSQPVEGGV